MSENAYKIYEEALSEQYSRNEARRIRTRVEQARQSPHSAGVRWPFELLQNALDAGPRNGKSTVTVRLRCDQNGVGFEHNGAPFTLEELAALLSGGSSKEFESEITTGRFGTGFLVTHVLADRTRLRGLMQLDTGCETFELTLDRGGDEGSILANIQHSHEAIRSAVPISNTVNHLSATFEYACREREVWVLGLRELKRALPYLYGTRTTLGRVEIRTSDDDVEVWYASHVEKTTIDGGYIECRSITVNEKQSPERHLRVYRFTTVPDSSAGALVLAERNQWGQTVCLPESDGPRVFREYPLRSSGFIPINFILDGKFDPDQERSGLLMSANDKTLLEQALQAAVAAVQYAIGQKWKDAHLLARASLPSTGFDATNTDEKDWWSQRLGAFAQQLAIVPIVRCESQFLPAMAEDDEYADFISPRLLQGPGEEETTVDRLWPLVRSASQLLPPCRELASDWTTITEGWRSLAVAIEPVCVARLADWVRGDAKTLDELEVEGDAQEWLAAFIDVVGECWIGRSGVDLTALSGMIPNQKRYLCSPSNLKRDEGVSERLKDICTDMEYDIRDDLLLSGFDEAARRLDLHYMTDAFVKAIPTSVNEDEIIADALEHANAVLEEGRDCDDVAAEAPHATVRLLAHLWESSGEAAASIAKQVPLLASNRRVVRWSSDRPFMAPVCAWPEAARPFVGAYPPNRVLERLYACSDIEEVPSVVNALVVWGMAYADPLIDSIVELRDRRLAALSCSADTNGVVVPHEKLSQIALLQPEVLNRCQEGIDEARALLGLVLCYVARHDPAWKEQRTVRGRRLRTDVDVPIRGALWLADLKVRAWVPVPGEDDKPQKMVANAATLKYLLNPTWLQENDDAIRLLSEWFDFDRLELRLVGIAQDEKERQKLRNSIAELVETGGADPQFYTALAREVEASRKRKRDLDRCRSLGLAVQGAIGTALRNYNLDVKLVDRGFDYEVTVRSEDAFHDAGTVFELGRYLVEVKATKTGEARLTPTQAATAAQEEERYVLCVVDLRQTSDSDLELEWTPDRVEALAKLVPDIGDRVGKTYGSVEMARTMDVSIQNESALRYTVPPQIWESGMSIATWVNTIRTTLS